MRTVRRFVVAAAIASALALGASIAWAFSLFPPFPAEPALLPYAYAAALAVGFFVAQRAAVSFPWQGQRILVALDETALFIGLLAVPTPLVIPAAAAGALAAQIASGRERLKATFNAANITLSAGLGVATFLGCHLLTTPPLVNAILATAIYALGSNLLLSRIFAWLDRVGIFGVFRQRFLHLAVAHAGLGISAGIALIALWGLSPLAIVVVLPFAYFARSYVNLSAHADREIVAHRELAEISFDLVGAADLDTVAEKVLVACGDLFRAGAANLEVEFPNGNRRTFSRTFEGGVNHALPTIGLEIPTHSGLRGRLAVSPNRKSSEAFTDADAELLRIVAAQTAALADNARALGDLNTLARRMELILSAAGEGIYGVDLQGRTTFANKQARTLLGLPEEVPAGLPHDIFLSGLPRFSRGHSESTCPICLALAQGGSLRGFEAIERKGEEPLMVDYVAAPMVENGRKVGAVVVLADVTARKNAERAERIAIERAQEIHQLKESNRVRSQLLSNASHELNTPLTPIRMQLELLRLGHMGDLSPAQLQSLGVIDRNVQRLSALVHDVLDVARLQSGRLRLSRRPMDLATVLRDAHESFKEPAARAGISLTIRCPEGLAVNGDSDRLGQVVYNFVSNALKFTPRGGTIALEAHRNGADIVVEIRDSGAGLSEDQMRRLFQPFSQVHEGAAARPGSGLGLYISRGIVEQHEGETGCRSAGPGHGATFWFKVPAGASPVQEPSSDRGDAADSRASADAPARERTLARLAVR
jgi:PAS domain S-box-containing protein